MGYRNAAFLMNKAHTDCGLTEKSATVPGLVTLKQRSKSTHNVYWPNKEAIDQNGNTVLVTIYFWDEETNAGMAFLPGVRSVGVERLNGTLRIKEKPPEEALKGVVHETREEMNELTFKAYRKVIPSRLRQLTEQDYRERGGVIETREGPATFQIGDYLGQDSKGEFRVRRVKVDRDFRLISEFDISGWADYQPQDVRLAAQLPYSYDLPNGQHGEAGDYLIRGSDSQWIVAQDLFEAAYQPAQQGER
jgi:hypothetical protein